MPPELSVVTEMRSRCREGWCQRSREVRTLLLDLLTGCAVHPLRRLLLRRPPDVGRASGRGWKVRAHHLDLGSRVVNPVPPQGGSDEVNVVVPARRSRTPVLRKSQNGKPQRFRDSEFTCVKYLRKDEEG